MNQCHETDFRRILTSENSNRLPFHQLKENMEPDSPLQSQEEMHTCIGVVVEKRDQSLGRAVLVLLSLTATGTIGRGHFANVASDL